YTMRVQSIYLFQEKFTSLLDVILPMVKSLVRIFSHGVGQVRSEDVLNEMSSVIEYLEWGTTKSIYAVLFTVVSLMLGWASLLLLRSFFAKTMVDRTRTDRTRGNSRWIFGRRTSLQQSRLVYLSLLCIGSMLIVDL